MKRENRIIAAGEEWQVDAERWFLVFERARCSSWVFYDAGDRDGFDLATAETQSALETQAPV